MIIKSHIRGGYTSAAQYLKEQGQNEQIRLVHISDTDAKDLHHSFHNMWVLAANGKSRKPLHHISINPMKGERLTDQQLHQIIERAEQKYGYKPNEHQRVIVEHVKDGRQHFHVMWNRVNIKTGKAVWPGEHWKKSKQICREMEKELGLKTLTTRRVKQMMAITAKSFGGKKPSLMLRSFPNPVTPYWILSPHTVRATLSISASQSSQPRRPSGMSSTPNKGSLSGMSEAQRIDFIAACEGKITWLQYFNVWGRLGL